MEQVLIRSGNVMVPAHQFDPQPDRPYLVFCPDRGGWHVGFWWTLDPPGRWVLSFDTMVELSVTHVVELPPSPMDAAAVAIWQSTLGPSSGSA